MPRMLGVSIIYALLLVSLIVPLLGLASLFVLLVPVLLLYVRLGTKSFLIHYIGALALAYVLGSVLIGGWLGALFVAISLFLLPPAIQMGNQYRKKASARAVMTAGVLTLLGELLISLLVADLLGLNPTGELKQLMRESFQLYSPQMQELLQLDIETLASVTVQMLPLYMISISLLYIMVSHTVTRRLLVRYGEQAAAFRPVKDWMLPKSFVWIYVLALIAELFVQDSSSGMFTIVVNLVPLLSTAFAFQGISFLFFTAYTKGWNKALPITGIVLLFVFPPVFFLLSLLGVFDVSFPIRDRMTHKGS